MGASYCVHVISADAVQPLLARVRSGVGIPRALRDHQAILGRAKSSVFALRYMGARRVHPDIARLAVLAVAEVDRSVVRLPIETGHVDQAFVLLSFDPAAEAQFPEGYPVVEVPILRNPPATSGVR